MATRYVFLQRLRLFLFFSLVACDPGPTGPEADTDTAERPTADTIEQPLADAEPNDVSEEAIEDVGVDLTDSEDETFDEWGICTPIPHPQISYCYEGRAGHAQREVRGGICEHYAPSREFPPVCDAGGPTTEWEPVWLQQGGTPQLQITCNLDAGCPEVVRFASMTTTETSVGGSFGAARRFVLNNGNALVQLDFAPSFAGGQSEDIRSYARLVSISADLELQWQTPDFSDIWSVTPTPDGDVLVNGFQRTLGIAPTPAGERWSSDSPGFLARLDPDNGEPKWVAHLAIGQVAGLGIQDGVLHAAASVFCDNGKPPTTHRAGAAITVDLETGDVQSCFVVTDTADTVTGGFLLEDAVLYRTQLDQIGDDAAPNVSISTISPAGVPTPLVNNIEGTGLAVLKLADGTWLWPLAEWVRFDGDGTVLSRTRPFGRPDRESTSPLLPIIGYNDTTGIASGGSPLTLVSTSQLLQGVVDVKYTYNFERVNTGFRLLYAMQDGTWFASGSFAMYVVDDAGNVLWSAQSAEVEQANRVYAQVLDDEHILVMINRIGNSIGTVRADLVDFYVIRHVHGGVANTQHATLGYDIYQSWIPPENPVLDGPEIEPRWTLAE